MKSVYLAGPISGLDYAGATDWREYATEQIAAANIAGLSPMRAKTFLKDYGSTFSKECDTHDNPLSFPRGIMTRDFYDATHCDVLLVNMLGATDVSIGTTMEIAWAYAKRTPIVCAMEYECNPHQHAMIDQALGYQVESLDEAIAIVKAILEAYR